MLDNYLYLDIYYLYIDSLIPISYTIMENNKFIITEDKFIPPLIQILEEATPGHSQEDISPKKPVIILKESLDNIFPEQEYDKRLQKAKEVLRALTSELSTQQLRDVVSEVQYLVSSWLDDFEREIFKGKTLKELLHEKGGL